MARRPPNVLSVAEKPSVAKELANILSNGNAQRRNGLTPVSSAPVMGA